MPSITPSNGFTAAETQKGFRHFALGLTPQEQHLLSGIKVDDTASYNNFGDVNSVEVDAAGFFTQLGNAPDIAKQQAAVTAKMVKQTIAATGAETAWITIRVQQPTKEYDAGRWHTDGYFYPPHSGNQYKAVIALKGAGTLLNVPSDEQRALFMQAQRTANDTTKAQSSIITLLDPQRTESTPAGMGTMFIAGSEHAAIHSEPPIHSERVFISILPGTAQQIDTLRQNWNKQTPREVVGNNITLALGGKTAPRIGNP